MNLVKIGVGHMAVSTNTEETLYTSSLGSCVAVTMYDTNQQIGGLAHIQLPDSSICKSLSEQKPACFADQAIPNLLEAIEERGAHKYNLQITIIGGASFSAQQSHDFFNIGANNIIAVKNILAKLALPIRNEDIGGQRPRSVYLDVQHGTIQISSLSKNYRLEA